MSLPSFTEDDPPKQVVSSLSTSADKPARMDHSRILSAGPYPCERNVYNKKTSKWEPCKEVLQTKSARREHYKKHDREQHVELYLSDLVRVLVPSGREPIFDKEHGIWVYDKPWRCPEGFEVCKVIGSTLHDFYSEELGHTSSIMHLDVVLRRITNV